MTVVGLLVHGGLLALGVALAAVPIIIHLLNRRRVQRLPWAAMEWLLRAMRRHQRRLKLENWLILLLRVAAIVLLGLALARPVLEDPALAGIFGGKRSVYVVLDTSYSMGAKTGARSVQDLAKAEVDALLSGLGPEDTVAVVVTNDPRAEQSDGRTPYVLVPRAVGRDGVSKAKEAVALVRPRHAPAGWAEALELLLSQTAPEDVNRLFVAVTDFQARDWSQSAPEGRDAVARQLEAMLSLDAAVRVVDVGGEVRRNLSVARVTTPMRRDAFVGRSLRLAVTVENHGEKPVSDAQVDVTLDDDPSPMARRTLPQLDGVDPGTGKPGSHTLTVDLPGVAFSKSGSHVLEVTIRPPGEDPGADSLGLDSRRAFAMRVRDRIVVRAWAKASDDASPGALTYLRGIYQRYDIDEDGEQVEINPLFDLKFAGSEMGLVDALRGRSGEEVDLVVMANVRPRRESAEALRGFVRGGGALLFFVGDRVTDPDDVNALFYEDEETRLLPLPFDGLELRDPRASERSPFEIDLDYETDHPLSRPFTGEDARQWIGLSRPMIWGRIPFREVEPPPGNGGTPTPGAETPDPHVVLRFTDGRPAVVEGGLGLGKTLWVATSVDMGWFEHALPFFLPIFLDESAIYLTRPEDSRRNLEVGRRILVTWMPRDFRDEKFTAPGSIDLQPTRYAGQSEMDRPMLIQDRVGTAGIWRLSYQRDAIQGGTEEVVEHFAVNPDAGEGALRRASEDTLTSRLPPEADFAVLRSWSDTAEDVQDVRQGEVSAFVLWVVFGVLILESLLGLVFGRRRAAARHAAAAPSGD